MSMDNVVLEIGNKFKKHVKVSFEGESHYRGEDGIINFVYEVLKVKTIYPYQEEILRAFVREHRVAIRGPHGLGKSCIASWVILWVITSYPKETDIKVVTTAGAWRQLKNFLWPEIRKWASRADWSKMGIQMRDGRELLSLSIRLPNKEAFAAASDTPELLEGAHGSVILYVFDESKSISDETFDAAEGAFSQEGLEGKEAYAYASSTPGDESGRFYDIHQQLSGFEDWWVRHVTLEECIAAKQISRKWVTQRKKQWGEDSEIYKRRALGEFASSAVSSVIPLSWIEESNERWLQWQEDGIEDYQSEEAIGVDVGGEGEGADDTVVSRFRNYIVTTMERISRLDTKIIADHVHLMDPGLTVPIAVDVIGIGAGVKNNLFHMEHPVYGVNVSEPSTLTDISGELSFLNLRSALWWWLREFLDPHVPREKRILLPPDDLLTAELVAPRWSETQRGVIKVESKPEIKKRLGRSTDHADSVLLSMYASLVVTSHGIWV